MALRRLCAVSVEQRIRFWHCYDSPFRNRDIAVHNLRGVKAPSPSNVVSPLLKQTRSGSRTSRSSQRMGSYGQGVDWANTAAVRRGSDDPPPIL
eukprot:1270665-Rhodomonas_salina.2